MTSPNLVPVDADTSYAEIPHSARHESHQPSSWVGFYTVKKQIMEQD